MRWKSLALVVFLMSGAALNIRAEEVHRDQGLERSLSSVRQGFQKTNSCLDIQTQLSINVDYQNSVFTIKEVCESYNKEYLVSRLTKLDLSDINYSSIGQFYEDNTTVTIQTMEGKTITETSTQKYILPPYSVTTNATYLTSKVLRFGDAESAGTMQNALKDAVKRCNERREK
jgi:hypothetical protein